MQIKEYEKYKQNLGFIAILLFILYIIYRTFIPSQSETVSNDKSINLPVLDTFTKIKTVNLPFNDISAIAAGGSHILVLKKNGTVWAAGFNRKGQLGIGKSGDESHEKNFVQSKDKNGPVTDASAIAAGNNYSLILKKDGTVWAAGSNHYGQLGIGESGEDVHEKYFVQIQDKTVKDKHVPITDVIAIAAGYWHSFIIKKDGTVWATGLNDYGQLGIEKSKQGDHVKSFIQVNDENGPITDAAAVSAGDLHSLILKKDGSVWAAGLNSFGQLGIDRFSDEKGEHIFVQSKYKYGYYNNKAKTISAGFFHSLIIQTSGHVYAAGSNTYGELGIGYRSKSGCEISFVKTHDDKDKEVSNAVAIAAGFEQNFVLKRNGTVWGTGVNQPDDRDVNKPDVEGIRYKAFSFLEKASSVLRYFGRRWHRPEPEIDKRAYSFIRLKDSTGWYIANTVAIAANRNYGLILKKDGTVWIIGANILEKPTDEK